MQGSKVRLIEGDDELAKFMSVPKNSAAPEPIIIPAARTSAGGLKGAKSLTPERRREIAINANKAAKESRDAKRRKAESGDSEPDDGGLARMEKIIIGGDTGLGVAGSKRFSCLFCGADTWLAPASQSILKSERVPVVCLPCYLTNPQIPEGGTFTTAQGRQELVEALGEDVAQHCLTEGVELIRAAKRKRTPEPWKV
jgi:hypothetical protein